MSTNSFNFISRLKKIKQRNTFSILKGNQDQVKCDEPILEKITFSSEQKKDNQSSRNFVITGEAGTEKKDIAEKISDDFKNNAEFIAINSNNYKSDYIQTLLHQSRKNRAFTLFFDQFTKFTTEQKHSLHTTLSNFLSEKKANPQPTQNISLIFDINSRNDLQPARLFQLDNFSEIKVEPLRNRIEDVKKIIDHYSEEFKQSKEQELSPELYNFLINHHWPGNVQQLRRSVVRLFISTEKELIDITLAKKIIPEIFSESQACKILCTSLLNNNTEWLNSCHPSVKKALTHIKKNFRDDISMQELSHHAHCSPSHLSFLLKSNFDITFKGLLNALRIVYAQQQIQQKPHQRITDLSLDAGFSDLSHFEKMFKRYSGQTPNQYRKNIRLLPTKNEGVNHASF